MPASLHRASDVPNFEPNPEQLPASGDYPGAGGANPWEERARQVGRAMGRTVAALRSTGARLKNTAADATDAAVSQMQDVKQQVKTGYEGTKANARQVLHDYPMHVVLTAGAAGLLLGVGMRIWRANK
ncbi:MAG TPA: hypothetical protein VI636_03490 [Candidatus Angelobacter sp.]